MELTCPSCNSKHRTEDYPGAFEIQCSCGYSILVPDEASLFESPQEHNDAPPSFDDAPMAMDELAESKFALSGEGSKEDEAEAPAPSTEFFSSLNLTDPAKLPDEMPYDPFELQNQWTQAPSDPLSPEPSAAISNPGPDSPKTQKDDAKFKDDDAPAVASVSTKTEAQDIVNRIQMASIGYLQGPLFDLDIQGLSPDLSRDLAEHTQKFLSTRTYLREGLSKDFEDPSVLFKKSRILAVPEILAIEIYLYCVQNQITCRFSVHKDV